MATLYGRSNLPNQLSAEDWCLLYKALIMEIHDIKSVVAFHPEIADEMSPHIAKLENLRERLGPGGSEMWSEQERQLGLFNQ